MNKVCIGVWFIVSIGGCDFESEIADVQSLNFSLVALKSEVYLTKKLDLYVIRLLLRTSPLLERHSNYIMRLPSRSKKPTKFFSFRRSGFALFFAFVAGQKITKDLEW